MAKLTIIGAGSVMFTKQILASIFSFPALRDLHIVLEDLEPEALKTTHRLAVAMAEQEGIPARISMETEQRTALKGADFVICAVQVGGLEAWKLDRDIPKKYGVDQEVGDTLGPGGIFRGLRHIPVILDILRDMEEVCPDAVLMNYSNPLAPLVWAANAVSNISTVGLCYGVTYTIAQLAGYLGVGPWVDHPYTPELWDDLLHVAIPEDVTVRYGGINHLCWILDVQFQGRDMREQIARLPESAKVYAADGVRCEMLKAFGYWCTENHWHMTDYVPYFRKNPAMIDRFLPRRWNLMELAEEVRIKSDREIADHLAGTRPFPVRRNALNAPKIINAMVSGEPVRINGNVGNKNLIDNLPGACVVEVPVMVDGDGLHPQAVGALPTQCAALCRTNVNVQELLVQGALTHDREAIKHAMMLDPLTAAVCTLDQISAMTDELFAAQSAWLPGFSGSRK
ncbi:MAG TPA: alpha-galactosidase [Desulfomicrobiaceae bacterium]|nr:alpha-galactosidase [Desulfomicrobiaceae bacterium]